MLSYVTLTNQTWCSFNIIDTNIYISIQYHPYKGGSPPRTKWSNTCHIIIWAHNSIWKYAKLDNNKIELISIDFIGMTIWYRKVGLPSNLNRLNISPNSSLGLRPWPTSKTTTEKWFGLGQSFGPVIRQYRTYTYLLIIDHTIWQSWSPIKFEPT